MLRPYPLCSPFALRPARHRVLARLSASPFGTQKQEIGPKEQLPGRNALYLSALGKSY